MRRIEALCTLWRTVFRKMRDKVEEHPTLNKRMASTLGARAVVVTGFSGGLGRVRLGDTVWTAEAVDGNDYAEGVPVTGEDTGGNTLKVKAV